MNYIKRFQSYLRSERAGRFYAAVTTGALLLSIVLLVAVMVPQTAAETSDAVAVPTARVTSEHGVASGSVEMTDDEASLLLAAALRLKMEVKDVSVSFRAPETLRIQALVSRDSVVTLMSEGGVPLAEALEFVLPSEIALGVDAALSAADGELRVVPVSVEAGGADLSGLLPDSVASAAADAIGSALGRYVTVESVEVRDGSAKFTISA